MDKWTRYKKELNALKEQNLYREMRVIESAQKDYVYYHGERKMMLASNSYLDLCDEPEIKEYAKKMLDVYGVGSGGSRLTTGTTSLHQKLEEKIADFKGRESALVFNTGFTANSGIIPALCKEGDFIFSDALNHASIIDGCRQSKARTIKYRHNDMGDLEEKIIKSGCTSGMIVSDAVFSMDGDIVNLPELVSLADTYGLLSMIDEAHATGVIGKTGRGTEEHFHMEGKTDILMGTLSKAIGGEGGYVCGNQVLIDYLKNQVRGFIFSTSFSPVSAASALKALEYVEKQPERVYALQENVRWFCECLQNEGVYVHSDTAIVPIRIGDEKKALEVSNRLFEKGYFISAIRYPTVKKGKAMLRAALMATHTKEALEQAARDIAQTVREVTI